MYHRTLLPLLLALALLPACRHVGPEDTSGAPDADTDADSDSETDDDSATGPECDVGFVEHPVGENSEYTWAEPIDMDQDGDLDVALLLYWGDTIAWRENVYGDGSWWERHTITWTFDNVKDMAVIDVDGDGDLDAFAASLDLGLAWWENVDLGGTVWEKHEIDPDYLDLSRIAGADLDGDGDGDLVVSAAWTEAGTTIWMENADGAGDHWIERDLSGFTGELLFATAHDLDADGDQDLVGATDITDLSWIENVEGDASQWTAHLVVSGQQYFRVYNPYLTDLDEDGNTDILLPSLNPPGPAGGRLWWIRNGGEPVPTWEPLEVGETGESVARLDAGDFDRDGDLDVVGAEYERETVSWWRSSDMTEWTRQEVEIESPVGGGDACAADLDGDGDDDILAVTEDGIRWLENQCL